MSKRFIVFYNKNGEMYKIDFANRIEYTKWLDEVTNWDMIVDYYWL